MKTSDFNQPLSSATLKENIGRQFGVSVDLNKYDREQLEDFRNKLRTRIFQHEGRAGINDLLTNETYQKDKAMLELLNTRIKEMLGEDIKKLRDKLVALDEAKKGVRDVKHSAKAKGSKPDFLDLDHDGNKAEPMKRAAKDSKMKEAIKKDRKEFEGNAVTGGLADKSIPIGSKIPGTNVVKKKQIETESMREGDEEEITKDLRSRGGDQDTKSKYNKKEVKPGVTRYTKKSGEFTSEPHRDTGSGARTKADTQARHDDETERAKYTGLRKVRKGGETQYFYNGKQIDQDRYERIASRPSAVGEAAEKKCNHTAKGKKCPVHGLKECGMGVYESIDPEQAGFYVVDEEGDVVEGPFDSKQEAYEQAAAMGRMYDVKYKGDVIPTSDLIHKIIRALPPDVRSDDITDPMDLEHYLRKNPLGRVFGSLSPQEQARVTDEVANYFYGKNGSAFGDLDEGKDEGKPGKNFAKIAKSAGKRYGSKEAGERVAGAVRNKLKKQGKLEESQQIFKHHVRVVNESLAYLLSENEEEKAKSITAAGDIVNDFTSWMQRVGQYQTKSMIELSDKIRADFGPVEAEAFKQAVGPALTAALEMLTQQREAISNAVATLAGEQMPTNPMGTEPEMPVAEPDMMNEPEGGDEFAAADAAAGGDAAAGRDLRESRVKARLRESHSIISKLSR